MTKTEKLQQAGTATIVIESICLRVRAKLPSGPLLRIPGAS